MFRTLSCCVLVAIVCAGCINIHDEKNSSVAGTDTKKITPPAAPLLRHVILFKFKDGTNPENIREVESAFASLPAKISEIKSFEGGANVSPDKRNEGFTHCFLLTFRNDADRDAYLSHPEFKRFGKLLWSYLDKVLVVDYWVK